MPVNARSGRRVCGIALGFFRAVVHFAVLFTRGEFWVVLGLAAAHFVSFCFVFCASAESAKVRKEMSFPDLL